MRKFSLALTILFFCLKFSSAQEENEKFPFPDTTGFYNPLENFYQRSYAGPGEGFLRERIKKLEKRNETLKAGKASANLAAHFLRAGKPDSSIAWFNRATKYFAASNAFRLAASCQSANGFLYEKAGRIDSAKASLVQSFELNKQAGNIDGEVRALLALSRILDDEEKHSESLEKYKQAAGLLPSTANSAFTADVFLHLGEELIHNGQEREALTYLEKAMTYANASPKYKAEILRDIGIVYYKMSDYNKAITYFNKSLDADYKLPALRLLRDSYLKLYATNRISGDSKKEVYYSNLYKLMKDSVENVLNSRMLSPDSFTMELKEKEFVNNLISKFKSIDEEKNRNSLEFSQRLTEAELERVKTEEALARLSEERMNDVIADNEREDKLKELEKQRNEQALILSNRQLQQEKQLRLIYILIAGVALVTTILFLMYNRYRLKRKSLEALDRAYSDLTGAHRKLKETQEQLIRSEKMASLGQMTAGIAHEIQNPLNFVLNFSESSNELLGELKSAQTDEERTDLVKHLQMNLSKISEHGKRADSIVKNMLQHSRLNKGEKTKTDLNKLVEEYTQLAFHGMRAKQPGFSCTIEKNLDPNLPELEMVQQDISRVLLNLLNNAFYAVHEKALKEKNDYKPTVRVVTEVYGLNIILTIADNGTGIPKKIREKIFEPFFTTKPTGQGTGLGLSLSFEILQSHGARMTMESEEGKGTGFKIVFGMGREI
ncbi:MAG: tetratricopeptide repeat protein [Bacteroidia bacterium]